MLTRPLIVGAKGNMGQRYAACLRYLGLSPLGVDLGDKVPVGFDSIIIATPTARHIEDINFASGSGVPILCEKPLATDARTVSELCEKARRDRYPLRMVNQYREILKRPGSRGPTSYDYFRHGGDGLAWDCINIIGMATGQVALGESSPIWTCMVNGERLALGDMDSAYIRMLQGWLGGDHEGIDYIERAHQKVEKYLCSRS